MIKTIHRLFNWMYQQHLNGKPLGGGHTISAENLSFLVEEPESDCEEMFVQKTFESEKGEDKLFRCNGCHRVYYCCRGHQKLHWKQQHKEECKRLDKNGETVSKFLADMVEEVKLADEMKEQE